MEFLKKHWMKCVMILFVILFMSTCASNCSNKNKLRTVDATVVSYDSIVAVLNDSIDVLNSTIKDLGNDIELRDKTIQMLQKSNGDLNKALNRHVVVNIKQETNGEK